MIRAISPVDVEALLAREDLDVVDVRGPVDWAAGHIPRARRVGLDEIKANARAALPRDGVIFVCQKGIRSLAAAQAAEAAGFERIYNVEGGTLAWSVAALPLVSEGEGI